MRTRRYTLRNSRPRPLVLASLALGAFLASAASARADDEAPSPPLPTPPPGVVVSSGVASVKTGDAVYMKNGGVVRGTLVDAVPGRPVQIQLATGEIWSIAWEFVDRVAPASAASASPGAPAASVPTGPMVRLHVDAPRNIEISGHASERAEWVPVCSGACDQEVPAGWEYQARGAGIKASAPFVLSADGGGARTVHVDPSDKGAFTMGIVGVCAGGPSALLGLRLTPIGAPGHTTQTQDGVTTTQPVSPSVLPAGLVVLGVGVVITIVGGVVALNNASTTVTQAPAHAAKGPVPPPRFLDADRESPRLPDVATSTLVN